MTEERIVSSLLMGLALVLGGAGCDPEPLGDHGDGGGSATGGTASVPVCDAVDSLPDIGTSCPTPGESRCDPNGNQCVCARGIWYCNTSCASTYPTEPAPCSDCIRGTACNYPSGASCACINLKWMCIGTSACPASLPATGDACDGLAGLWCDYPNSNPANHMALYCEPSPYSSTASIWGWTQSAPCPATQPAYSLTSTCTGIALCSYGSTRCTCPLTGYPWICGLGILTPIQNLATPYNPCADGVDATRSDGKIFRGRVYPDTSIQSNADAGCVVKLDFSGAEIVLSDGGCRVADPQNTLSVQIFVGAGDTSVDAAGTLHAHIAPRDGAYASGPSASSSIPTTLGGTVDLTVTADGHLVATLSAPGLWDPVTLSGRTESACGYGGDAGPAPMTIPVSGGGTFGFPCWSRGAC